MTPLLVSSRIGNAHSRTPTLRAMAQEVHAVADATSLGGGGASGARGDGGQAEVNAERNSGIASYEYAKALKAAKPTPPRSTRSHLAGK
jgi:hypothetical protein